MSDAPRYLVVPRAEAFVLPAPPRPVPLKAWLRASFWAIAGLVFLSLGVVTGMGVAHLWERESLGRLAFMALLSAAFLWAGVVLGRTGLQFPGIYRQGKLVAIDLQVQGAGPAFWLRITDDPPEGATLVDLEHSILSGGTFTVWGTFQLGGAQHTFRDMLAADDRMAGVLVDGEVSAAAIVDPARPEDRAILVTRRIAGSLKAPR